MNRTRNQRASQPQSSVRAGYLQRSAARVELLETREACLLAHGARLPTSPGGWFSRAACRRASWYFGRGRAGVEWLIRGGGRAGVESGRRGAAEQANAADRE